MAGSRTYQPTNLDLLEWISLIALGLLNVVGVVIDWPSYDVFLGFAILWLGSSIPIVGLWCVPIRKTWQAQTINVVVVALALAVNWYYFGAMMPPV